MAVTGDVMKGLDKDGSGKLEFNEVKAMVLSFAVNAPKQPTDDEIQKAFTDLDKDNSGSLEINELVELVKNIL